MTIQVRTLPELIDLALRTPIIGVVNFDILRVVLHILVKEMGLTNFRAKVNVQDMKPQKLHMPQPPRQPSLIAMSVAAEYERQQHLDEESDVPHAEDIKDQGESSSIYQRPPHQEIEPSLSSPLSDEIPSNDMETSQPGLPAKPKPHAEEDGRQRPAVYEAQKIKSELSTPHTHAFHEDMAEFWKSTNISSRISALESGIEKIVDIIDEQARDLEHFRRDSERRRVKDTSVIKQIKEDIQQYSTASTDLEKKLKMYIKDEYFHEEMDRHVNYIDDMNNHLQDLEDRLEYLSEKLRGEYKMVDILMDIADLKAILKIPTRRRPSRPEGSNSGYTPDVRRKSVVSEQIGTEMKRTPAVTDFGRNVSDRRTSVPEEIGPHRGDEKQTKMPKQESKPEDRKRSSKALKEDTEPTYEDDRRKRKVSIKDQSEISKSGKDAEDTTYKRESKKKEKTEASTKEAKTGRHTNVHELDVSVLDDERSERKSEADYVQRPSRQYYEDHHERDNEKHEIEHGMRRDRQTRAAETKQYEEDSHAGDERNKRREVRDEHQRDRQQHQRKKDQEQQQQRADKDEQQKHSERDKERRPEMDDLQSDRDKKDHHRRRGREEESRGKDRERQEVRQQCQIHGREQLHRTDHTGEHKKGSERENRKGGGEREQQMEDDQTHTDKEMDTRDRDREESEHESERAVDTRERISKKSDMEDERRKKRGSSQKSADKEYDMPGHRREGKDHERKHNINDDYEKHRKHGRDDDRNDKKGRNNREDGREKYKKDDINDDYERHRKQGREDGRDDQKTKHKEDSREKQRKYDVDDDYERGRKQDREDGRDDQKTKHKEDSREKQRKYDVDDDYERGRKQDREDGRDDQKTKHKEDSREKRRKRDIDDDYERDRKRGREDDKDDQERGKNREDSSEKYKDDREYDQEDSKDGYKCDTTQQDAHGEQKGQKDYRKEDNMEHQKHDYKTHGDKDDSQRERKNRKRGGGRGEEQGHIDEDTGKEGGDDLQRTTSDYENSDEKIMEKYDKDNGKITGKLEHRRAAIIEAHKHRSTGSRKYGRSSSEEEHERSSSLESHRGKSDIEYHGQTSDERAGSKEIHERSASRSIHERAASYNQEEQREESDVNEQEQVSSSEQIGIKYKSSENGEYEKERRSSDTARRYSREGRPPGLDAKERSTSRNIDEKETRMDEYYKSGERSGDVQVHTSEKEDKGSTDRYSRRTRQEDAYAYDKASHDYKEKRQKKERREAGEREHKEDHQRREGRQRRVFSREEHPRLYQRRDTPDSRYSFERRIRDRFDETKISYFQGGAIKEEDYEHQGELSRSNSPRSFLEEDMYSGLDIHSASMTDRDEGTSRNFQKIAKSPEMQRTLEAFDMDNIIGAAAEFDGLQNAIEDLRLKIDKIEDQNREIRRIKERETQETEEKLVEKERLIDKLTAGIAMSSDKVGDVVNDVKLLSEKVYEVIEMVKEIGKTQDEMVEEGRRNLQEVEEQMREIFKELRKFAMLDDIQLMVEDIKHSKAERSELLDCLDRKADKVQLESKLDKTMFENYHLEFNRGIDDMIIKMASQEQQLERAVQDLHVVLEQKVEKKEMEAYREHMKERVRAIVTKLKHMKEIIEEDPDAAGIKIRCISCDRPLRKPDRNHVISDGTRNDALPKPKAKSGGLLPPIHGGDGRSSGGWHTLSSPPLRITTTTGAGLPAEKLWEEVPLQGTDGRVYQGYVEKPTRTLK